MKKTKSIIANMVATATRPKNSVNDIKFVFSEKAKASYDCFKHLIKNKVPSVKNMGLYLLLFAIELNLKRILLNKSKITLEELKKKEFGHNLINLNQSCIAYLPKNILINKISSLLIKEIYEKEGKKISLSVWYSTDLRYFAGLSDIFTFILSVEEVDILKKYYKFLMKYNYVL
jgi:hypothetical protein